MMINEPHAAGVDDAEEARIADALAQADGILGLGDLSVTDQASRDIIRRIVAREITGDEAVAMFAELGLDR